MGSKNSLPPEDVFEAEKMPAATKEVRPLRAFAGFIATLMVLVGVIWLAEVVGLLAWFIPGVSVFGAWYWGVIGLLGVILLALVVTRLR